MDKRRIHAFFKMLDHKLNLKARVILVGASAGTLMGHVRPSVDIDFEILPVGKKTPSVKNRITKVIEEVSRVQRVAVNYSENIAGWSRVNYLDYRRTATLYKIFGQLEVRIVAPEYWTIGKMARFLELDVRDMLTIIHKKKIPAERLIALWAKAINSSDLSLELGQFRDHVLYFLRSYGTSLWGRDFDFRKHKQSFLRQIGQTTE